MSQKNKTILAIEDDGSLRNILLDKITGNGFEALGAEDGEEGLKLALEKAPDLILLDLMLPKLDGFQVLDHIRKNEDKAIANVPVVVLSNLWSNKDILRIRALKIEEYYVKANTNLEEVFMKIGEILNKDK